VRTNSENIGGEICRENVWGKCRGKYIGKCRGNIGENIREI